ncbi:MAG: DUF547 domain-containing protein [Acidobacteria bacterium]|nr:DUF547 domain-containing protein [Acidobacteriota bacterium]
MWVLIVALAAQNVIQPQGLQAVFDAAVMADGTVDYAKLKADPDLQSALDSYVLSLDKVNPLDLNARNERIAFFANAYNACTLKGVLEAWPVDSVRDIKRFFGFFTQERWSIGGRKYALNDIEKEWLRPVDPGIHFIINCASRSCPKLTRIVFTADNVESAMEQLAKEFVLDATKNRFREDGVWELSKIFDWYEGDFGGRQAVIATVNRLRGTDEKPKRIHYLEYDWSLNGPTQ